MFYSDKPIAVVQDDLLNRGTFSRQLAKAILSYTDIDNFTISLCGKWGCGKTSILNMVVQEINTFSANLPTDKKPIIVNFNPWNYSDQSQLISQFFDTIRTALSIGDTGEKLKIAGNALQKYSAIFDYSSYIPVVGKYLAPIKSLLSGLGEHISEAATQEANLVKQKQAVIDALKNLSQKIIVIIDDIDRLNNNQIRLIFQLVNSLAGFPNMIYILSFDKEVVARALGEEQKSNGEEYLEKIIQMPFDVPETKLASVQNVFFSKLNSILTEMPKEEFDQEYWSSVFRACIAPFMHSIRDVNRITNVFRFKYGLLYNETNWIDLAALTTLQVCEPDAYNWIYHNISRLTGSIHSVDGKTVAKEKENRNKFLSELSSWGISNSEIVFQAIQTLFPKIAWIAGGHHYSHDTNTELRRKQRIANSERSELYFTLSLENVSIPKSQILNSINDFTPAELHDFLHRLSTTGKLSQYMDELCAYLEDIPSERVNIFYREMVELQTLNDNRKSELNPPSKYVCAECMWNLLRRMDSDQRIEELRRGITTSGILEIPIYSRIIYSIERAYGIIGEYPKREYESYKIVSENNVLMLERQCYKKIIEFSMTDELFANEDIYNSCVSAIWNHINPAELKAYQEKWVKKSYNIPKFLLSTVVTWRGSDDYGWVFDESRFLPIITKEEVYEALQSIKGTQIFTDMSEQEKYITIAFCCWYEHGCQAEEEISYHDVVEMCSKEDTNERDD